MEHLIRPYDESERQYQSLLDIANASWPDVEATIRAIRERSGGRGAIRVLRIKLLLEPRPAG